MTIPANDYDKDAGLSGLAYRTEDNIIIESILTNSAAVGLPPVTFPFQWRVDQSRTPNVLQIRNPSNAAFVDVAEVTDTLVNLFSGGAGVPSLGAAQTFTEAQSIDQSGTPGSLTVGSNLTSGIVARIPMRGHNSTGSNVDGVNLVCRVNTNTAGSEDFTFEVEVIRGGSAFTVAQLGSLADFRRSGGGGVLDADTIQQAGITLAQIVREATGRLGDGGDFTSDITSLAQTNEGQLFRFTGSSNATVSLNKLAKNTVIYFLNESPTNANLTFAAAAVDPVTDFRTSQLTLPGISGQAPTCAVHWYLSDGRRINIVGDNV